MEQKQEYSCLRDLSPKYPWLVVQNLEAEDYKLGEQIFYPIHDPLSQYQFRIPVLLGRGIRGCFHGWVILSNHPYNYMWSIWNPVTSKVIHLPPLMLQDGDYESIDESCLSSPPEDPRSVLLLTRYKKPTIVFCRLDRLQWTETSYAKQLRCITGDIPGNNDNFLHSLTCCNGKVYTFNSGLLLHVGIVVKDKEVVINLLPLMVLPFPNYNRYSSLIRFLKGSCTELFRIILGFDRVAKKQVGGVCIYKLDMTSMIWEEVEDLKDAIFFIDLAHDYSIYYLPEIASELGGYVHVLDEDGKTMQSLHFKDKIVSLSSMPSCLGSSSSLSLWECGLPVDHGEVTCRADSKPAKGNGDIIMVDICSTKNEANKESHLLNIPFDILEMIMELCVGVEYLNFRATCKTCQLGAPLIRWSKETTLRRLQTPWLVVVDDHQGLITFTDPMFGDKYFIKTPRELNGTMRIHCSRYGWLLMMIRLRKPLEIRKPLEHERLVFFNPFTRDIRELPSDVPYINMASFSAPPTSPDCVVVGFGKSPDYHWPVYVHTTREPYWRMLLVDMFGPHPHSLRFPAFHGQDLYALRDDGGLVIIKEIEDDQDQDYSWAQVVDKAPRSSCGSSMQYFLVKGDECFLLVKLGGFGDSIEVFRLNDSTKEWEKIDGLGRHVIYICDTTCIYIEAKTQEMENKIYFPRLHSENGKIVFYSLETCAYHTSNGKNMEENFIGTQHHTYTHTWIEPSWS